MNHAQSPNPTHTIRWADATEADALIAMWHESWHDGHAEHVPQAMLRARGIDHFRERYIQFGNTLRTAGPIGQPCAVSVLEGDELSNLFVAREARGSGLAAALLRDAETRLAAAGHARGWLACAVGNVRAARFYARCGWGRAQTIDYDYGGGTLPTWIYEKGLAA
ncbi:MAG: GNAT family N-acetyltransferase [Pseudomonadota bacterium]